jgi:hypothetical protein
MIKKEPGWSYSLYLILPIFLSHQFFCGLWFYLPSEIHVCLLFVFLLERTEIAISQPCAVRLSWNLVETSSWYPKLACMCWFQDSIFFHFVNKQTNQKTRRNLEKRGFRKHEFSPPFQVRLIWNSVGTSGRVLGIVEYVCFVYIIVCLHFVNRNKKTHFMDHLAVCGRILWNLMDDCT